MKTLTIKLNMPDAQELDDRGHLNPPYITRFIANHIGLFKQGDSIGKEGLLFTYTFKIDDHLHKVIKLAAIEADLSMAEFVRQLFDVYYY